MRRCAALLALVSALASAAPVAESTSGTWDLYVGTAKVSLHSSEPGCVAAAQSRGAGSYGCRSITRVTVKDVPAGAWAHLADEGLPFTANGLVRYGALDAWVSKEVAGAGQCTNEFFGSDPASGVRKSCEVAQAPAITGTVWVRWVAPSTNVDGTPLTDLAGFEVLYGTEPGVYSQTFTLNDPSATEHHIRDLPAGTHYVAVIAFDTSGNKSPVSVEASKIIR